ncbi:sigma-70 family RNA polymerase sigma factor [Vibrio tetraodonis]|uniref:sigma-70 family RNA polymerase sigma factor n=1 Tax=Vibrio tetraodonis TaxID=2231647 RepID=UPI000E0C7D68|nr:sigma-70 family RNA polymerase sigma factor [Vibrio tetraodonis]
MTALNITDASEVDSMYREHHSWLSLFIQRRLTCPQVSADLVQDTYVRLMVSRKLPPRQDSRRYLTHIAKGLVVDLYRRKRIESAYLDMLEQQPSEFAVSTEDKVIMINMLVEVDAMLHKMPFKVRQALILRQVEGLSYKEIAQCLNVSISSVEKYVARALQSCILASIGNLD